MRKGGAVPATIGILNGVARVGLADHELNELVEKPGARKISRRDLAFAVGCVDQTQVELEQHQTIH